MAPTRTDRRTLLDGIPIRMIFQIVLRWLGSLLARELRASAFAKLRIWRVALVYQKEPNALPPVDPVQR